MNHPFAIPLFRSILLIISCLVFTSCDKAELILPEAGKIAGNLAASDQCSQEETAWAAGERYANPGNWATFTAYNPDGITVPLIAAENVEIGEVVFSAEAGGKVLIQIVFTPDSGWALQEGEESVKIQGYENPPSGNPAPGLFSYKDNELTVEVHAFNYYGVHLDVKKVVDCD